VPCVGLSYSWLTSGSPCCSDWGRLVPCATPARFRFAYFVAFWNRSNGVAGLVLHSAPTLFGHRPSVLVFDSLFFVVPLVARLMIPLFVAGAVVELITPVVVFFWALSLSAWESVRFSSSSRLILISSTEFPFGKKRFGGSLFSRTSPPLFQWRVPLGWLPHSFFTGLCNEFCGGPGLRPPTPAL